MMYDGEEVRIPLGVGQGQNAALSIYSCYYCSWPLLLLPGAEEHMGRTFSWENVQKFRVPE